MKTIVWDLDDVLNDLMREWHSRAWRPAHPECTVSYEAIRENPPHEILGVGRAEYLASLDEFRRRDAATLAPNPLVTEWFEAHGDAFHHAVLTAVPLAFADVSAAWVMRHFGRWIRAFQVVPSPRPGVPQTGWTSKREFLAWWGRANVFVDDSASNVQGAVELGITGVLFPRPWNAGRESIADTLRRIAAA